MIRHVVLCRFRKDQDVAAIFKALTQLQDRIPGILAISSGADNSPEGLQKGFSHGFTVDFIDAAARDAYLPHPEHQAVGKMIVEALEGGLEGLAVLDWEM
ncbi:Dabb family protein [Aestuariivirga sp.]|uniref:Dabb family protein n=1 Tax=Aestuariivirga sp. TaxID=2650926 RepID=UPI0039193F57